MRRVHVVVALAALVAACSQESSVAVSPGCGLADGRCVASDSMTDAACAAQPGTWHAGGCPSAERVGACATSTEITSYYRPYWSASWAEYECDGTWAPEPAPYVPPATGGGSTARTMSCTMVGLFCFDVAGTFSQATIDTFEADCGGIGGNVGSGPCALSGALPGYCSMVDEDYGAGTARLFSSTIFTLADARVSCQDSAGTWVD